MLRGRGSEVRILERTRDLTLLQKVKSGSGAHTVFYSTGIGLLFRG